MSIIWKVQGEDNFFKQVSGNEWVQYVNGQGVNSYKLVPAKGDDLILQRGDGAVLYFDAQQVVIKTSESAKPTRLYIGTYINESAMRQTPKQQQQPRSSNAPAKQCNYR